MRAHDFHALCELAYAQAGIRLGEEKRALVSARVGRRLRALNLRDERDYLEVLRADDGPELSEFLDVISTHFTSFFREPAHFELLVDDLRQRMERGQQQFTVWCAAASSGEEPYTIALVLDRLFSGRDVKWRVLATDLVEAVRSAYRARHRSSPTTEPTRVQQGSATQLIAIGASTGGTVAIEAILRALPAQTPGIVMVQHMPAFFTRSFAERLDGLGQLRVREAVDGDVVEPGLALLAPGDRQVVVRSAQHGYVVSVVEGPRVSGHRPSVDVLFRSVARAAGKHALGVILTGMGADGALGLLELRKAGGRTLGQDEASCVVYGMPKVAFEMGAVERQVSLRDMAQSIAGS